MFNKISKRSYENCSITQADKSAIVSEQLTVTYDSDTKEYGLLVSKPIRGEIISLVIFAFENDYVVDGKVNIVGKLVTFLKDTDDGSMAGLTAEIKYLSE